ncbi:MAG TPA: hypothetical protein VH681_00015, partial [Nitrospiraceae bacterium]
MPLVVTKGIEVQRRRRDTMIDSQTSCARLPRQRLRGVLLVVAVTVAGCLKPVPTVVIPSSDPSPPTLAWEIYNLQTRERQPLTQDSQMVEVPASDQIIVTIAVEDLQSGVKEVSLSGEGQYACELGGKTEQKPIKLEQQNTTRVPDHENKVPVSASLSYTVEFGKMGCKEAEQFGGGKLSLVGKGQNFVNGNGTKSLHFNLKKQASP